MATLVWLAALVVLALQWERGCLVTVSSCSLTLTVDKNGTNNHGCLKGMNPCTHLDYVLNNIDLVPLNCSEGEVKITVSYSHGIGPGLVVANFSSQPAIVRLEVEGSLYSNPVKVLCDSSSGLVMAGTPNVSLVFRNLFFSGCIYRGSSEYSRTPFFITASEFDSVEIDRCSMTESASVRLESVYNGIVKNSVFSYGILNTTNNELVYTSFALECDCHELLVSNTTFLNNNPRGGLGIRNCNASVTTIRNCYFDHNLPGLQLGTDFRLGRGSRRCMQSLLLQNTTFTRNPRALFIYSSNLAQITLNSLHNKFIKRGNLFSLGGAVVIAPSIRSNLSLTFTHDVFVGNESPLGGMIWFDSAFQDNKDITRISTKFLNCTFMDNKAGDGAVLYSNVKSPNIFISFSKCYLANNQIILSGQSTLLYSGIIHTQGGELTLADCTLADNSGTAMVLESTQVSFKGEVNITGNIGTWGGAIHWLTSFNVTSKHNATVLLTDNIASKGGAIYFGKMTAVSNYSCEQCSLNFSLVDNIADDYGHSLYFEDPKFIEPFNTIWRDRFNIHSSLNATVASSAKTTKSITTALSLFPGERISVNMVCVDYWNQNSSCDAQFVLVCNGTVCRKQDQPQLGGNSLYAPLLYIQNIIPGDQLTSLKIVSKNEGPLSISLHLVFWCEYSDNNASITINLTSCPKGFYYESNTRACKCQKISDELACSVEHGVACIKQGYWFGQLPDDTGILAQYIVAPCDPKYCSFSSLLLCPSQVAPTVGNQFYALPKEHLDEQCGNNQGGFLCYGCRDGYHFTFQAVRCVSESNCHPWQPPILILFTLVYQLITIVFIVVALRMNLKVGSGVLYGPLFALVVTNLLLNSCHSQNLISLQVTVTTLSSLLQLNPEFYGYIPWCFIDALGRLGNYALRYISPFIIGLSLLLLACVARRFPRFLSAVQRSPVQLVCLLLLLTFWSLTETTFMLLIPVTITGVPGVRVFTDPQVSYFHNEHIILALLAIGVAVVFIVPFTTILLLSPFCRARLHRISPILDEFQSCYKDRFRWYSAVYFIFWVALSISHQLSSTAVQIELIILAILQLLVQPYAKRWLNTMDNMIIISLVLLSVLLGRESRYCDITDSDLLAGTILIYILVLFLVSIIPFGILFFLVYRCFRAHRHSKMIKLDPLLYYEIINDVPPTRTVTKTQVSLNDFQQSLDDREPMITIEQLKTN